MINALTSHVNVTNQWALWPITNNEIRTMFFVCDKSFTNASASIYLSL